MTWSFFISSLLFADSDQRNKSPCRSSPAPKRVAYKVLSLMEMTSKAVSVTVPHTRSGQVAVHFCIMEQVVDITRISSS